MNLRKTIRIACLALGCIGLALAQSGVDNSTSNGVFQMEGDATRTATICWLPVADGGPAIATPGTFPTSSTTTTSPCPSVNPAGAAATWSLITFGSNTDDWSSFLFSGGVFTSKAHSLFVPTFVTDPSNSASDNTFLGTSSKDTQDITQWTWNPHGVQNKDDIEHAYSGAYKLANGDIAIYAGMDRLSNAGDSTAGFWFVQDSTFALCTGPGQSSSGPNANCTASGTFLGKHFDGDLLIVSDFSTGGAVSTINVFVWQGGSLVLDATRSPAPCDPLNGGNNLCGLVNNAFAQVLNKQGNPVLAAATITTGGWPFVDFKGNAVAVSTGEFLEIAVDLNAIFGANIPCFSTFFSETRSSTSPTASLSDLTSPVSFPLCSLSVNKACTGSQILNGGAQIQYNFSITVTNTGPSTIYNATVKDTPPSTAYVANSLVVNPVDTSAGIAPNASVVFNGNFKTTAILGTGDKNTATVTASSSSAVGGPQNVDGTADWGDPSSCGPTITTGLSLNKKCESCLQPANSVLQVQVTEGVQYCNSGDTTVSNISVQDCRGTLGPAPGQPGAFTNADTAGDRTCSIPFVTLVSGGSLGPATTVPTCATVNTNTVPSSLTACIAFDPTHPSTTGNCSFADAVVASGTAALFGAVTATPASTSCPLCPINTTCPAITFP